MTRVQFTPEIELELPVDRRVVPIKGQVPRGGYPFTLADIFPTVPSLSAMDVCRELGREFERVNEWLRDLDAVRPRPALPTPSSEVAAVGILHALLHPALRNTSSVWQTLREPRLQIEEPLSIEVARPFPLGRASPARVLHTLSWVDTNLKLAVERMAALYALSDDVRVRLAQTCLRVYALLMKSRDFYLARHANFNHSMFLQDRIVNLIFGDVPYQLARDVESSAGAANAFALRLLADSPQASGRQLCTLGAYMGVTWTTTPDLQRLFVDNPTRAIQRVGEELASRELGWGVDDIDEFLARALADVEPSLTVILDDNGESVFDLALVQWLLTSTGHLTVTFVVNQNPISNNISLNVFRDLLKSDTFARLRAAFDAGRAEVLIEDQPFRSFELEYLTAKTRRHLKTTSFAFIRGANFFETCQPESLDRYYSFVVNDMTSMQLTGFPRGMAVFAHIPAGQVGYMYSGPNQIRTLKDIVDARRS